MPKSNLPRPQKIVLPNGKTRTLYRDHDGRFISKAAYLQRRAQIDIEHEMPAEAVADRSQAAAPAPDRIAAEALQQLVKLIESRLPLLDRLLQPSGTSASSNTSPASGINATAEQVKVGGDAIARDKVTSVAGDHAERDIHKGETFAPQIAPGDWQAELLYKLLKRIANRELPLLEKLIEQLKRPSEVVADPLRTSATELVGQLTHTVLPSIETLLRQLADRPGGDSGRGVTASAGQVNVGEDIVSRDKVTQVADNLAGRDIHQEEVLAPQMNVNDGSASPFQGLIDRIVGHELPLLDKVLERLAETPPPPAAPPISDTERVQRLSAIKDDRELRNQLEAYLSEARRARQKPRLAGANWAGRNLAQLDLHDVDLTNAQLARCTLSGTRLDEATLAEADLDHANLEGASLRWCQARAAKLSHANLKGADCERANLAHADLSAAEMSGATVLHGANLEAAILRHTRLPGVNLSDATLVGADARWAGFSRANLSGARLNQASLDRADLSRSDLRGADLRGARVNETRLDGARINRQTQIDAEVRKLWEAANFKNPVDAVKQGGSFAGARLWEAQFAGLDLTQADLSRADLWRADLNRARLTGVKLVEANLAEANLSRAQLSLARLSHACLRAACLRQVNLQNADLTDADLSETDLLNADLTGADLSCANLRGAKHLTTAQLNSAKSLAGAIMPDGSVHK